MQKGEIPNCVVGCITRSLYFYVLLMEKYGLGGIEHDDKYKEGDLESIKSMIMGGVTEEYMTKTDQELAETILEELKDILSQLSSDRN